MNYTKIYESLLHRAKMRGNDKGKLDYYTEKHRKIPGCMGGTYDDENVFLLTPEEHFVAHQLLVKIYPKNKSLVWAAIRMTHHSSGKRVNNKLYGWLRKRHSEYSKTRIGNKNPSYGKLWFHNPVTGKNMKIDPDSVPSGWVSGRGGKVGSCKVCGISTKRPYHVYCDDHREKSVKETKLRQNKKKAEDLFQQFLESDCNSVTHFAKTIGTSQPRLTQLWNRFIDDYKNKKKHGISFKKG